MAATAATATAAAKQPVADSIYFTGIYNQRDRSFAQAMLQSDRINGCWVTYVNLSYGNERSLCCNVIWVFGCDRNLPVKPLRSDS